MKLVLHLSVQLSSCVVLVADLSRLEIKQRRSLNVVSRYPVDLLEGHEWHLFRTSQQEGGEVSRVGHQGEQHEDPPERSHQSP